MTASLPATDRCVFVTGREGEGATPILEPRIADVGNPSQSQVCFPSHVMVKAVQMFFLEPWLMERLNL